MTHRTAFRPPRPPPRSRRCVAAARGARDAWPVDAPSSSSAPLPPLAPSGIPTPSCCRRRRRCRHRPSHRSGTRRHRRCCCRPPRPPPRLRRCAAAARGARAAWPVGARRSEFYVIEPLRDPECLSWHGAIRLDLFFRPCAARARARRSSAARPSGRWISRGPHRTRARARTDFPPRAGDSAGAAVAAGAMCACVRLAARGGLVAASRCARPPCGGRAIISAVVWRRCGSPFFLSVKPALAPASARSGPESRPFGRRSRLSNSGALVSLRPFDFKSDQHAGEPSVARSSTAAAG